MMVIPNGIVSGNGSTFDPIDYITSLPEWNSSWQVEVLKNNVDLSKPGTYKVVYQITTADGATFEQVVFITVKQDNDSAPDKGPSIETGFSALSMLTAGLTLVGFGAINIKKRD